MGITYHDDQPAKSGKVTYLDDKPDTSTFGGRARELAGEVGSLAKGYVTGTPKMIGSLAKGSFDAVSSPVETGKGALDKLGEFGESIFTGEAAKLPGKAAEAVKNMPPNELAEQAGELLSPGGFLKAGKMGAKLLEKAPKLEETGAKLVGGAKAGLESELKRDLTKVGVEEGTALRDQARAAGPLKRYVTQLKQKKMELASKMSEFTSRAAKAVGLPEAHQVRGSQLGGSVGDDIRSTSAKAFEDADKLKKEDQSFQKYLQRAKELEEGTSPFAGSDTGIDLLKKLDAMETVPAGSKFDETGAALGRAAGKLKEVILGRETELEAGVEGTPPDFEALLGEGGAGAAGAPGKAPVRGNAPSRFKLLDEELRKIRDNQYRKDAEGASDISRRQWKQLGDLLESHLEEYVGKDFWPRDYYAEAAGPSNKFRTDLGRKLTGKQDVAYIHPDDLPAKVDPQSLPKEVFRSETTATEFKNLVGEEHFNRIATQHLSNELHGLAPDQIQAWRAAPENVWHKMLPGGEMKALQYQEEVARSSHDIKAMEEAIKGQQKYIKDRKAIIQRNVKAIREKGAAGRKDAKAANEAQQKLARSIEDLFAAGKPKTRVSQLQDLLKENGMAADRMSPAQMQMLYQELAAADKAQDAAERMKKIKSFAVKAAAVLGTAYVADKATGLHDLLKLK
jgi:hypothetical protein